MLCEADVWSHVCVGSLLSGAWPGEFTGLDIEMTIHEHYNEVLQVVHRMFKHIFEGLESR